MNKNWLKYKGEAVRLIINDVPFPKPKDGIFIDIDETHVFLKLHINGEIMPFSRLDIKRVILRNNKELEEADVNRRKAS